MRLFSYLPSLDSNKITPIPPKIYELRLRKNRKIFKKVFKKFINILYGSKFRRIFRHIVYTYPKFYRRKRKSFSLDIKDRILPRIRYLAYNKNPTFIFIK